MGRAFAALAIALGIASASRGHAEQIYTWTDEQGRVHYSNRSGTSLGDSSAASEPGGEGWESVLEKQQSREDFREKAEAAINSLELQMIRKKRARGKAQEALEATQANIVRAQASTATNLPMLKAHEATQITNLRKLDAEIGAIEMGIAKIRALKAAAKKERSTR